MDERIHSYLKIGLVHSQAYPETFESDEVFIPSFKKVISDHFFKAIEFHSPKDRIIRKECIKILKDSPLYKVYLGTAEFMNAKANMFSYDRYERDKALALSYRLIDDAIEWGVDEIMFSNAPDPGEDRRKDAYKYLEEYYVRLAEYIGKNGYIKLTMEVIDRNPLAKNYLCGSTTEARQLWDKLRRHTQNFGLVIDLSHLPLLGEEPTDAVREAGEAFVHGHIGTCVMNPKSKLCGDMHPGFQAKYSENGIGDIVDFIRAGIETKVIREKSPVPLSIEVHPYGNETTDDVVKYAKDLLSKAWDEIKKTLKL